MPAGRFVHRRDRRNRRPRQLAVGIECALHVGTSVDDDVAEYESMRVARSRGARMRNSSGVSSMNVVVALPERNVWWSIRLSRNAMFVFTPRMRNSRRARSARCADSSSVLPHVVTLTSSESRIRRDHRSAEAVAPVETNGKAARRSWVVIRP